MSDLVHSVIDGRLREQRWRMKATTFARRIYLIEGDYDKTSTRYHHSIPASTIESVLSSLPVTHGYFVHRSPSLSLSVAWLKDLYKQVVLDLGRRGVECKETYAAFDVRMRKRGSGEGEDEQRRVWGSQLRMIRGVSPMIAGVIVDHYPSLRSLVDAYEGCVGMKEEEALLEEIKFGAKARRVGGQLSKRIRQVFRMPLYEVEAMKEEEREEAERVAAVPSEERERRKEKRAKRKAPAEPAAPAPVEEKKEKKKRTRKKKKAEEGKEEKDGRGEGRGEVGRDDEGRGSARVPLPAG